MFRIGIIGGAGKMGRWFANLLSSKGYIVGIYDKNEVKAKELASRLNVGVHESLEVLVKKSDVIIISVLPRTVPHIIKRVKHVLMEEDLENKVVFDITTFKGDIVELYKTFPRRCKVSSVHPLFGPRAESVNKYSVIIVPIPGREGDSIIIADFFQNLGFKVRIVDFRVHDRIIAFTIGISYAIGVSLASLTISLDTKLVEDLMGTTFRYLSIHYKSIIREDKEFIEYILSNRDVKTYIGKLIERLVTLNERLQEGLANIDDIKNEIEENELDRAYEIMYKCLEKFIL